MNWSLCGDVNSEEFTLAGSGSADLPRGATELRLRATPYFPTGFDPALSQLMCNFALAGYTAVPAGPASLRDAVASNLFVRPRRQVIITDSSGEPVVRLEALTTMTVDAESITVTNYMSGCSHLVAPVVRVHGEETLIPGEAGAATGIARYTVELDDGQILDGITIVPYRFDRADVQVSAAVRDISDHTCQRTSDTDVTLRATSKWRESSAPCRFRGLRHVMMQVPVSDITEIDATAPGQDIAAAVESLRTDGVVILRQAVDSSLLASLQKMVAEWHSRFLAGHVQNYSLGEETATVIPEIWRDAFTEPRELQGFRKWNVAGLDERIIPLVDAEPLYGVIHRFMGPDLMVTKSQMIVLPPSCIDSPFLHTDAGGMADIVESMDASPLMVSAQVFLTDLPEPGMGNFTCVPGSHRSRYPWSQDNPRRSQIGGPLGQDISMDIRRQVLARAGDAAVFIHSLWHGVTNNASSHPRRSAIVSYAKSFVRPYDYQSTPAKVVEHGTPRQRLLFGDLGGWSWRPGCCYHLPDDYLDLLDPRSDMTRVVDDSAVDGLGGGVLR